LAQKVGETPDRRPAGRAGLAAGAGSVFVRAYDKKQKEPRYPTWSRRSGPSTGSPSLPHERAHLELLQMEIKGHDDPLAWWNDNIELCWT